MGPTVPGVTLKWPNDVLVDLDTDHGGKLCGILSERVDGPSRSARHHRNRHQRVNGT